MLFLCSTVLVVVRASLTALDREGPRPARPEQCNATSLPWLPSSLACCIGPVERVGYVRLSVGSWQVAIAMATLTGKPSARPPAGRRRNISSAFIYTVSNNRHPKYKTHLSFG